MPEKVVTDILRKNLIDEHNLQEAEENLLAADEFQRFLNTLSTSNKKAVLLEHLRLYVDLWRTDMPCEVSTTNRYAKDTIELKITAQDSISSSQVIKGLVGTMIGLNKEKADRLVKANKAISLVHLNQHLCFFLGLACFVNHDCEPNAKLEADFSRLLITVRAIKNIKSGQEITVEYGKNYFRLGNKECLCATCENLLCGGWSLTDLSRTGSEESLPAPQPSTRSLKRASQDIDSLLFDPDHGEGLLMKRQRISFEQIKDNLDICLPQSIMHNEDIVIPDSQSPSVTSLPASRSIDKDKEIRAMIIDELRSEGFARRILNRLDSQSRLAIVDKSSRTETPRSFDSVLGNRHVTSSQRNSLPSSLSSAADEQILGCLTSLDKGTIQNKNKIHKLIADAIAVLDDSPTVLATSALPPSLDLLRVEEVNCQEDNQRSTHLTSAPSCNKFLAWQDFSPELLPEIPSLDLSEEHVEDATPIAASMKSEAIAPANEINPNHIPGNNLLPISPVISPERIPGDYRLARLLLAGQGSHEVQCLTCHELWIHGDGTET